MMMERRGRRGLRRVGTLDPAQTVLALAPFLWWRADTNIVKNGSNQIASWATFVGNATFAQAVDATKPTYVESFAGKAAVNCTLLSHMASGAVDPPGNQLSIAFPLVLDTTAGTQIILESGALGLEAGRFMLAAASGQIQATYSDDGVLRSTTRRCTATEVVGTPAWFVVTIDAAVANNQTHVYRNGAVAESNVATAALASTLPTLAWSLAARVGVLFPLDGRVPEIIVFSRVVSAADVATIGRYFRARYGV